VHLVIQNGTLVGGSPALVIKSGDVLLDHVTLINATDAPTLLVNGGSLKVRNSTIQESTGYAQAAIRNQRRLGPTSCTATDPGGNTVSVNGPGELIRTSAPSRSRPSWQHVPWSTGGAVGSGFALEDLIYHAFDAAGVGRVVTDSIGEVYVTPKERAVSQRGRRCPRPPAGRSTVQGDMEFRLRGRDQAPDRRLPGWADAGAAARPGLSRRDRADRHRHARRRPRWSSIRHSSGLDAVDVLINKLPRARSPRWVGSWPRWVRRR